MRRLALGSLLSLVALAASCSRESPVSPPPPAELSVVLVQPPARSAGYAYDGQIWALFDRSLDARTVDSTTVFLKQDTRRLGCDVGYEPTSKRIVVVPRTNLSLNKTYTVLITTRVHARDGSALAADYEWQFSTSSIGRIVYLDPAPGTLSTPVGLLRWSSPGAVPGQLLFDVYAGTDSASVHNRTVPRIASTANSFYLPRATWPGGTRMYWAITTTNVTTGEKLVSPVTTFLVQPDGAPTHEVPVYVVEYGAVRAGVTTQYCLQATIPVGAGCTSAARFDLSPTRLGTRVRSARLTATASQNPSLIPGVGVYACSPTWYACGMVAGGPPFPDDAGPLAMAHYGGTSYDMVFESAALAAWAEGMLRGADFSGLQFVLVSSQVMTINMRAGTVPAPILTVTVYD